MRGYNLTSLGIALLGASVFAVSALPTDNWKAALGLSVFSLAEYEGSEDQELRALVLPNISYQDKWFLDGFKLGRYLYYKPEKSTQASVEVVYQLARDESDNSRLKGLGDIDATGLLKLEGRFLLPKLPLQMLLKVRNHLSESRRTDAQITIGTRLPLSPKLAWRIMFSAVWASEDYMQTYFGVNEEQSLRSVYDNYELNSGLKHFDYRTVFIYQYNERWKFDLFFNLREFSDKVFDSPIVYKRSNYLLGTKASYSF